MHLFLERFSTLRNTAHHPHSLICEYLFILVREWQCICNGFNTQLWALYLESERSWHASLELLLDFLPGKNQRFFHTYFTDQVWMMSKLTKNYEKCKNCILEPRGINSVPPAVNINFLHVRHPVSELLRVLYDIWMH